MCWRSTLPSCRSQAGPASPRGTARWPSPRRSRAAPARLACRKCGRRSSPPQQAGTRVACPLPWAAWGPPDGCAVPPRLLPPPLVHDLCLLPTMSAATAIIANFLMGVMGEARRSAGLAASAGPCHSAGRGCPTCRRMRRTQPARAAADSPFGLRLLLLTGRRQHARRPGARDGAERILREAVLLPCCSRCRGAAGQWCTASVRLVAVQRTVVLHFPRLSPHAPPPCLPCQAQTYTVVGFMGTGRVPYKQALTAVFIEGGAPPQAADAAARCLHPSACCSSSVCCFIAWTSDSPPCRLYLSVPVHRPNSPQAGGVDPPPVSA